MAEPGKTEKATPKRREDGRKKGQVAKSIEVNVVINVLMAVIVLKVGGDYIMHNMKDICIYFWGNVSTFTLDLNTVPQMMAKVIKMIVLTLLPILAVVFLMGIVSNVIQFGFMLSFEPLKPSFDRINPAKGFKRIFLSKRLIFETVKAIVKIAVIGYILYSVVKKIMNEMFLTPLMDMDTLFMFCASAVYGLSMKIIIAFIVFAVADYLFQRYDYEDQMKMSKQEIKDEMRQMEGDPMIKMRIRQIQREMARTRMISEIPTADVVITNPTHVAVALRYRDGEDQAPKIVAKGMNLMAEKIKSIAREKGIIIVENPPLARTLVKLEAGWEIPPELFQAVAEILAYVFQAKGKIRLENNGGKVDNNILARHYIPHPETGGSNNG
ncbi:MAG: flagellar biosynthesis protein FlhB [Spirochaetia bacterium]|nr:flagellar biosynthesis protein FlhB [Spirochaetia bacterium]